MKRQFFLGTLLLALLGCQPPLQVTSQARRIAVRVDMDATFPGLDPHQKEELRAYYCQQVEARLRQVADVVTDAQPGASERPLVEIQIEEIDLSGYPTKGDLFHGWLVDSTVQAAGGLITRALAHETGPIEQDTPLDETLVGRYVVRGIRKHQLERLGYRPLLVSGELTFHGNGLTYTCAFDGWKLLPRMHPLPKGGDADQSPDIRKEEGRALADYVMARLGSSWQWSMSPD